MNHKNLTVDEIAAVLGDANFAEHQAEAEERYGDSDDWAISQERASKRDKAEWESLQRRTEELEERLATVCDTGVKIDSTRARALAEEHRDLLSEYFPVSYAKHVLIARGYTADPRFRAHYDGRCAGLAAWLQAAVNANATAHGVDPQRAEWV